jgi:Tfp pilus assembly protein PilZ
MAERPERRACERFVIPWATASYSVEGLISAGHFTEDLFPIVDISLGGLRLLTDNNFKLEARVTLKISIPGDISALDLKGKVNWLAPNPERSYKYQVGIQLAPYSEKKGENSLEVLKRLKALEERFLGVKGTPAHK